MREEIPEPSADLSGPHLPIPSSKPRHMPLPLARMQFFGGTPFINPRSTKPIHHIPSDRDSQSLLYPTAPLKLMGTGSSSSPRLPICQEQKKDQTTVAPRVYVRSAYIPGIYVHSTLLTESNYRKLIKKRRRPICIPLLSPRCIGIAAFPN